MNWPPDSAYVKLERHSVVVNRKPDVSIYPTVILLADVSRYISDGEKISNEISLRAIFYPELGIFLQVANVGTGFLYNYIIFN